MQQHRHTLLPKELVEAYTKTDYVVDDPAIKGFVIRIGRASFEVDHLLETYAGRVKPTAAFLTACNPLGQALSDNQNSERHFQLIAQCRTNGWVIFEGYGAGENTSEWPSERSLLILGLSKDQTVTLGKQLAQNAIVWMNKQAMAELILLR